MKRLKAWDDSYFPFIKARKTRYMVLLFNEVNPFLLRFCSTWNFFGAERDDLIQETWRIFFTKLDEFRGESQLRSFICGILLNQLREHNRRTKRVQSFSSPEEVMAQRGTMESWWNQNPTTPEEILLRKEILHHVQSKLQSLPSDQRKAFFLREIKELETKEICKMMGITSSHCGVLIFRAKNALKQSLQKNVIDLGFAI